MACHDFTYPLGHIVTAKYWHRVVENGLHLTVAESGWQVLAESYTGNGFAALYSLFMIWSFDADGLLKMIEKYKLTILRPPTIYRFLIQQDLSKYDLSSLVHCSTAGEPLNPGCSTHLRRLQG